MHYSATRGLAIACRLSVRVSVTLMDCDHSWNSSKIVSRLVSLGCSLSADPNMMSLFQGEHPEILFIYLMLTGITRVRITSPRAIACNEQARIVQWLHQCKLHYQHQTNTRKAVLSQR